MSRLLRQTTEQRSQMILTGPIFSTLLWLSFPTLMMGTVQSVIPLVDGLFII